MENLDIKIATIALVSLFSLGGSSYGERLEYQLSKDEIKWGEPVTLEVRSENPYSYTVRGGITLSFSSRVIVVDKDYGVSKLYYEGDQVTRARLLDKIPARDIMVENWYPTWGPGSTKTMRVTFFPLSTGVLRITVRAAFLISMKPRTVVNIPSSSECSDQQEFPAQCLNIFVKGAEDFMENLRLLVNSVEDQHGDELLRHLHTLIDDPDDRSSLAYFGIDNVESSKKYFEKYLEAIRLRMKDPAIRDSPYFFEYLKRIVNNPADEEALRFFKLSIKREPELSLGEKAVQEYVKECESYLNTHPGGAALLSLMAAEGDLHFIPQHGARQDIVVIHKGKGYSFKRNRRIVLKMIDSFMKIKANSKYIYEPEPVSGYSFLSLKRALKKAHR